MNPMLAVTLKNLDDITLPVYLSPKLDGIRCIIHNGVAVSRKLEPIPNKFIQEKLKGLPDGLDGELIIEGSFDAVQSGVMSEDGEPEFLYILFDVMTTDKEYLVRYNILCETVEIYKNPYTKIIQTLYVEDLAELKELEVFAINQGYEGLIMRAPISPYKHGRSTNKESYLVKYKRFFDREAQVIGFEELYHNDNEKTKDALGHSKRSSAKAGLRAAGTLGSLIVYDGELDKEFKIGTGFTAEQRKEIWDNKNKYLNMLVTYQYQELTNKGKPRFPSFKAFRGD